ncbi:hypothetical protein RUND412_007080 [Rhizina undulata]
MLLEHIFGGRRGPSDGKPLKNGFMVSPYSKPSLPSPVASFVTARTSFTTRSARHSLLMNIEPEYDVEDDDHTRKPSKGRRASQRDSPPSREEERGTLEQKETHEVGGGFFTAVFGLGTSIWLWLRDNDTNSLLDEDIGFGQSETSPVGSASSTIRNEDEPEETIPEIKQDKGKGKENEVKKEESENGAAAGNTVAVQIGIGAIAADALPESDEDVAIKRLTVIEEASEDGTIHQQQEDEFTVIAVDVPLPPSPPVLPETDPNEVPAIELIAPVSPAEETKEEERAHPLERSKSQPPVGGTEPSELRRIPSAPKLNDTASPTAESLRNAIALIEALALKELNKAGGSSAQENKENKENVPPVLEGSFTPIPPHISHVNSSATSTRSSIPPIAEVSEPDDIVDYEGSSRLRDYHRAVADRILHPKLEGAESGKRVVKEGDIDFSLGHGKDPGLDSDDLAPNEVSHDNAIDDDGSERKSSVNGLPQPDAVSLAESKDQPRAIPRRRDSVRSALSSPFAGLRGRTKSRRGSVSTSAGEVPPISAISRSNSVRQQSAVESTHELTPPPTPPTASISDEKPKLRLRSNSIFRGFSRKGSQDKPGDKDKDVKSVTSAEPGADVAEEKKEKKEKKPIARRMSSMNSFKSLRDTSSPLVPVITREGSMDGASKGPKDGDPKITPLAQTKRRPSWFPGNEGEKRKFSFTSNRDKDKADSTHTNDPSSPVTKDTASEATPGRSTPGVDSEANSLAGSVKTMDSKPLLQRSKTDGMRTRVMSMSMSKLSLRRKEKEK